VVNNVVSMNSWPSIAGVGCGLVCIGAGEEQARKVYACVASGSGETSRLGSRDPVADRTKCKPHAGKKSKMKSCRRSQRRVAANNRSLRVGFVGLATKPTPNWCKVVANDRSFHAWFSVVYC
jgi:hypothetical protein